MENDKKILLDCDVLIHFQKGSKLSILGELFKGSLLLLDIVKDEFEAINKQPPLFEIFLKHYNIKNIAFPTDNEEILNEFIKLEQTFGRGESACMAYAKFNDNIIASSNLRDIKEYCEEESITIYTTMDILYKAYSDQLLTEQECDSFLSVNISKGSKLPVSRIRGYTPLVVI